MEFFDRFTSNTIAGSGNQLTFATEPDERRTGRLFYKISFSGTCNYALLFSNIVDSTFSDGRQCHKNHVCTSWQIHSARIGRLTGEIPADFRTPGQADPINARVGSFAPITFGGQAGKSVAPGEFFHSDPVLLSFDAGDYLCLEMTFSGPEIPYHEETLLPVFKKTEDGWIYSNKMPFAGMVGCDRPVKSRIGYLGDSITQGIGPAWNSYLHWNALLSQKIGGEYAHWNLGLGYARSDDMASGGAWMYKARHNDICFVCYGVNDLFHGFSAREIIRNLNIIVDTLKAAGIKVILQTVPPFDYADDILLSWHEVNDYIHTHLSKKVAFVFDTVPALGDPAKPEHALYGPHPNAEGSAKWADALYNAITEARLL